MNALSNSELKMIAGELQPLVGAQLQEVQQTETEFGLGFYHNQDMFWLWFDLDPRGPLVLFFEEDPPPRPKQTKPLLLFTRANFVGHRLKEIRADEMAGRILFLEFSGAPGEERTLEARLFPHGQNILLSAGEKKISWAKVKEIPPLPESISEPPNRSYLEIKTAWLKRRGFLKDESKSQESEEERAKRLFEKNVQKKTQALEKIRDEIKTKLDPVWREVGDWLKTNGNLDVPSEYAKYVDHKESLAWNIQNTFSKAKANERKVEGSQERLRLLEIELEKLKKQGPTLHEKPQLQKKKSLLEAADVKGRRLVVGENLEAYIGKNAADNLALLRRSQPHDYWLHLRDYPGSHAIVRRAKNRKVTDKEFNEIGKWLVIQSLKKSEAELKGGKYDLILAECRFVKPIKGDKLGRVTYQNDRLFVVKV